MSDEKNSTTLENISINTVRCGNVVQGKLFLPYVYLEGSDQQGKDISLIAYKDTALQLNEVLVASEIRDSEGRLIVSSGFIQEGHYVKHDISKYGIKMNFGDAVKKVNEDKAIFNFKEASFAPEVQARIDAARKAWVAAVQSALIPEVDHDTVLSSGQDMTQAPQEEASEVEPLERSPSALESEVPADPQQVDDVNELLF